MSKIEILIDESTISKKIDEIAGGINSRYLNTSDVIILCIMKGGFIFAADLIRKLEIDFDLAFIEISSYGDNKTSGKIQVKTNDLPDFKKKNIIVIDDIIDTGNTIVFLNDFLKNNGAQSVEFAAILVKHSKYTGTIPIAFPGIFIEDFFVVGYGMDYAGRYRNLPYIGILHDT